jgi:hypothetical protein
MANDPLSLMNAQFGTAFAALNQQLTDLGANFTRACTQTFATMNAAAPHNVLASMGGGAGTFSAKIPTSTLNRQNIFG